MEKEMSLTISYATTEQASLVHSIVQAAFAEYRAQYSDRPTALPGALNEPLAVVEQAVSEGRVLLAFDGDTAVGTGRYEVRPDHFYIGRVAVLPSCRGKGVGATLMRYLEALAPTFGHNCVRLGTRESLAANVTFYTNLGYTITNRELHSSGLDTLVDFEKHLEVPLSTPRTEQRLV